MTKYEAIKAIFEGKTVYHPHFPQIKYKMNATGTLVVFVSGTRVGWLEMESEEWLDEDIWEDGYVVTE